MKNVQLANRFERGRCLAREWTPDPFFDGTICKKENLKQTWSFTAEDHRRLDRLAQEEMGLRRRLYDLLPEHIPDAYCLKKLAFENVELCIRLADLGKTVKVLRDLPRETRREVVQVLINIHETDEQSDDLIFKQRYSAEITEYEVALYGGKLKVSLAFGGAGGEDYYSERVELDGDEDVVSEVLKRIRLEPKSRVPIPDELKKKLEGKITPLQKDFDSAIADGRFENALKVAESIAVSVGEVLDPSHEEAEEIIYSLGDAFRISGRPEDLIRLGERVVAQREAVLGANSRRMRVWLDWLADSYEEVGRRDEALQLHEKVDEIFGRCPHCYGNCCKGNRGHHRLRESKFHEVAAPSGSAPGRVAVSRS